MPRTALRNDQWNRIKDLLPGKSSDRGVTAKDNRKFLEAVLWIARTGAPWRDLSEPLGNWHRVYVRYNRWCHKETLGNVFDECSKDKDPEHLMIDDSIARAHQYGAPKKHLNMMKRLASQEVV